MNALVGKELENTKIISRRNEAYNFLSWLSHQKWKRRQKSHVWNTILEWTKKILKFSEKRCQEQEFVGYLLEKSESDIHLSSHLPFVPTCTWLHDNMLKFPITNHQLLLPCLRRHKRLRIRAFDNERSLKTLFSSSQLLIILCNH